MKNKPLKPLSDYDRGFERACLLFLSSKMKWSRKERATFGKVTHKLFGKRRK